MTWQVRARIGDEWEFRTATERITVGEIVASLLVLSPEVYVLKVKE